MPYFAGQPFLAALTCDCTPEPCAHDETNFTRACLIIDPDVPVPPLSSVLRLSRDGANACRVALRRRILGALGEAACVERWTRQMRSGALMVHNDLQFLVELLSMLMPDATGLSPLLAEHRLVEALGKLGERSLGSANEVC